MKTLKVLLPAAIICFVSTLTVAQDAPSSSTDDPRDMLQFGLKAGINYSAIYNTKGQNFLDNPLFGPAFGGFLSVPFGTYLGIQPEVLYSAKGFSGQGTTGDGQPYSFRDRTNYLDIPIMLQLKLFPNLYLLGGPEYSYLLSHTYIFTNGVTSVSTQQEFQNDNITHNVFGLIFGLDINFSQLTLGGRVAWDLQDNNGNGTSTLPQYRNLWGQVTLGVRL
jgi:Outer membrane protein beta-barrel domain